MKNRIVALVVTVLLAFASAPASAQMAVTDPATQAILEQILGQQVTQTNTQTNIIGVNNVKQEEALLQQIMIMKQQGASFSQIFQAVGPGIVGLLQKNNDIMTNDVNIDPKMLAELNKLAPKYAPGATPYLAYVNQLNANTRNAQAQALGVANASVQDEQQTIAPALAKIGSTPPSGQLQALQELVQLAQIDVQQMDKLIKIQSAMMKAMEASWAAQLQANQTLTSINYNISHGAVPATQVISYCTQNNPFFGVLTGSDYQKAYLACQTLLVKGSASPSP